MDKIWLIKINGEDNLFYDSNNKEYRLRLFCPNCHKLSGCQCYKNYDDYLTDYMSELPIECCSYSCCLAINTNGELENIVQAAIDIGLEIKPVDKYTEKEAENIVEYLNTEGIWDGFYFEESAGEQCKK